MEQVSVIIPTYNRAATLRRAVDSVLRQRPLVGARVDTRPALTYEVLVVDDGSTDGSLEVLWEYRDRIQLLTFSQNRGAIAARNHVAGHAQGEYLVFLDGDDILMPWALNVYETLILKRKPKVILGQTVWFTGSVPELKDVMEGMVEEFSEAIWNVGDPDLAPKNDEDWEHVEHATIGMIETAKFLMVSDLAKDKGDWAKHLQDLINANQTVLQTVKGKDVKAVFEAGNQLIEVCNACHKE